MCRVSMREIFGRMKSPSLRDEQISVNSKEVVMCFQFQGGTNGQSINVLFPTNERLTALLRVPYNAVMF